MKTILHAKLSFGIFLNLWQNSCDFVVKHDYNIICQEAPESAIQLYLQIISHAVRMHNTPLAKEREHLNGFE